MLYSGLYEQIINNAMDRALSSTDQRSQTAPIDAAEASKVLAKYVAEVAERGLENLKDQGGDLKAQVALANQIIATIQAETQESDFDARSVAERAEQLFALFERQNSIWAVDEKARVVRPETSIARSSYDRIDFLDAPVDLGFACPLDLHCTYTRDQILVALDFLKPATVREGVKWLPEKQLDVFFVTLNKADKDYSPTTMYNDYSISDELFHWQSQSTTAENSPTGQRYIHHRARGSRVLLFVREFKSDRITGGAEAYTCLGTASYVKHEGEKPMNITWKLDAPIPAKYLRKTNKLVVG